MSDETRLWRTLMSDYEKDTRPVKNSSKPVTVFVTFNLLQLEGLVSILMCTSFTILRKHKKMQKFLQHIVICKFHSVVTLNNNASILNKIYPNFFI